MEHEALVAIGSAVKFLDEERKTVGGYLVRFSGANDPDLYGDFFSKSTDFGVEVDGRTLGLYYNHGMDGALKQHLIGRGAVASTDTGLWFEAQLDDANEYADMIRELIDQGKLGYSSGAVGHLVRRSGPIKGAYEITHWPLGEASLVTRPAEPRNVVTLKSLIDTINEDTGTADADAEAPVEASTKDAPEATPADAVPTEPASTEAPTSEPIMEQEVKQETAAQPAVTPDALKSAVAEAVAAEMKAQKEVKAAPAAAPTIVKDLGDSERIAVAHWMRTGDEGAVKSIISGPNQIDLKASNANDMTIGDATYAGNTVTDDMYSQIIARRDESMLADKLGVMRFTGTGTSIDVPVDGEADGEFVSTAEAGTFDLDAPVINQTVLTLVKYSKRVVISYELLQDTATNLTSFLSNFVGRGLAKTHNDLLVTEVETNGTDLKATASTTAAVLGEFEDTVFNGNLSAYLDDTASVGWVMQSPTYGKILTLGGTSNRYYAPTAQGDRVGPDLLGFPVHFSQKCEAYGTAGNKFALFGNFGQVGLYESPGLTVLRDPYSTASTGQVSFHYYTRCDYGVLQGEAIGYIRHTNT